MDNKNNIKNLSAEIQRWFSSVATSLTGSCPHLAEEEAKNLFPDLLTYWPRDFFETGLLPGRLSSFGKPDGSDLRRLSTAFLAVCEIAYVWAPYQIEPFCESGLIYKVVGIDPHTLETIRKDFYIGPVIIVSETFDFLLISYTGDDFWVFAGFPKAMANFESVYGDKELQKKQISDFIEEEGRHDLQKLADQIYM